MPEAQPTTRTVWRAVRWPVVALVTTLVLLQIGLVLDTMPPGSAREMALVIGGPALTVLLPLSLVWFIASLLRYRWQRQR
jgi:hypothetical protein